MEERNKRLQVSKVMKEKRQETLERITTEYGTKLRMNRSIQAEGSFAVVKEDMGLRQYLYPAEKCKNPASWPDFQRLFRGVAFFKCDSPFMSAGDL